MTPPAHKHTHTHTLTPHKHIFPRLAIKLSNSPVYALDLFVVADYLQQEFRKFIHTAAHTPHHSPTINTALCCSHTRLACYTQKHGVRAATVICFSSSTHLLPLFNQPSVCWTEIKRTEIKRKRCTPAASWVPQSG